MHVARYVVRAGARQRTAIAFLDGATLAARGSLMQELLEAAGAAFPQVAPVPAAPDTALPVADVLLFGHAGHTPAEVATQVTASAWFANRPSGPTAAHEPQVWALDVDVLLVEPGPQLVDSVEALLRIVMPEALGANGTPPSPDLAVRVLPGPATKPRLESGPSL